MKRFWIIVQLLAMPWMVLQAAQVENLYKVRWPVNEQSAESRDALILDAFVEVLIRVSGRSDLLEEFPINLNLRQVNRSVLSIRYETNRNRLYDNKFWLHINFNPKAVENLLTRAEAPVWSANRPLILAWVAIDDDKGRRLVNHEQAPRVSALWQDHSMRRGLPSLLPALDLQDAQAIQPSDIRGQFEGVLETASKRYGVQTVVGAHIQKFGDYWITRWLVLDECGNQRWRFEETNSLEDAIGSGMDRLGDFMGQCYGISIEDKSGNKLEMVIDNIRSTKDYAQVIDTVEKITGIKHVDLKSLEEKRIVLGVSLDVDEETFLQALRLIRPLQRVESLPPINQQLASLETLPNSGATPTNTETTGESEPTSLEEQIFAIKPSSESDTEVAIGTLPAGENPIVEQAAETTETSGSVMPANPALAPVEPLTQYFFRWQP